MNARVRARLTPALVGALVSSTLLAVACGTDVGNPAVLYSLSDPHPGDVTVTSAWIAVDAVELYQEPNCQNGPASVRLDGPMVDDLFASRRHALDAPAGDYCRLDVIWGRAQSLPPGAPARLMDHTVVLEGTRGDGEPFTIVSVRGDRLVMLPSQGTFPVDDTTHALFVDVNGVRLMQNVDLSSAAVMDGEILVDASANTDQLDAFELAFNPAATLYDDDDGNGVLDPAERGMGQDLAQGQ